MAAPSSQLTASQQRLNLETTELLLYVNKEVNNKASIKVMYNLSSSIFTATLCVCSDLAK